MSDTIYCSAGDINLCKVLYLGNLHSILVIRSINSYTDSVFAGILRPF